MGLEDMHDGGSIGEDTVSGGFADAFIDPFFADFNRLFNDEGFLDPGELPQTGGTVPIPNVPQAQPRLTTQLIGALLNLGPGCTSFFGGKDTLKQRAKQIAGNLTIVRWNSSEANNQIPGFPNPRTYRQFWDGLRSSPVAAMVATGTRGSYTIYPHIIVGPRFYDPANLDPDGLRNSGGKVSRYQDRALVREFMHVLNKMDDTDLANHWKLGEKGYNLKELSLAIKAFLDNDCQSKKKK